MMFLTGRGRRAARSNDRRTTKKADDEEFEPATERRQCTAAARRRRSAPRAQARRASLCSRRIAGSSPGRSSTGSGHRFFGLGLVMPLDQMHSENPPSHPELLDWLARDIVEHGYDLRRLIRGLVLSRGLRAVQPRGRTMAPRPIPTRSPSAVRPLTPLQLATSLCDRHRRSGSSSRWTWSRKLGRAATEPRGPGARLCEPASSSRATTSRSASTEALLFSNSDRMQKEFLADGRGPLVGRVEVRLGRNGGDHRESACAVARSAIRRVIT